MKAYLINTDLGLPPIIGETILSAKTLVLECSFWTKGITCFQPDQLDNEEFNLVLKSPMFVDGMALARSCDFDFKEDCSEISRENILDYFRNEMHQDWNRECKNEIMLCCASYNDNLYELIEHAIKLSEGE